MTNAKQEGAGVAKFSFAVPADPIEMCLLSLLPFGARVTSVEIRYKRLTHEAAIEAAGLKRHDAAVKANATRKANAAKKEVQP